MKDDLDSNVKFIELVKERPCLYDFSRSDYNDRSSQDAAWTEIAIATNVVVSVCKDRWKNLRGCYTRHLKNVFRQSTSARKIKPYYLAEQLQFLNDFTKGKYNLPNDIFKTDDTGLDGTTLENYLEETQDLNSPSCSETGNREVEQFWLPKRPKRESGDILECFQTSNTCKGAKQDPDFAFLYSLLPDVKNMTREQKRRFKMGALKLVDDILEEKSTDNHNTQ